jgi:hypothetical protein
MSLEVTLELPEAEEIREREVAALRHEGVDDRRDVSDREVPEIAGRIVQALRVHVHLMEEERRPEVRGGQGAARVAALRAREKGDDVPPHEERPLPKLVQAQL